MKGTLGILGLLVAMLSAAPAVAGTLYKCVGADGVPSYVSKRVSGASCRVVGDYAPGRRVAARPVAKSSEAPSAPAKSVASPVVTAVSPNAVAPTPASATPGGLPRRRVSGQLYAYMKDGVRHYSSARPSQVASIEGLRTIRYSFIETCYACALNPGVNFGSVRLDTGAYRGEIAAAAREFGVEEAIVRAIIHAESAYNPLALSRAGAQGLMQLMPGTARRFGVGDAYDAGQNIRGGVQYLAWLLRRFNGDLTLAAAGYNAGEGAVDRYDGVPPYAETQRYVQRVGVLAERYRGALASAR
ncbi:MAG: lytic transglycosylase domain-containing protein [Pseudomonas sp.]